MYGVLWETICPEMLFSLTITLFAVVPPDKFNSFTNLIFDDVTLKHSIFVFFWRLGAERLVEPSLVSPLRSLLPRCPCDFWEFLVTSQLTVGSRFDRAENAWRLGFVGARTAVESTETRNHNNPGSGTLPGAVLTIDLAQGGKAKEQTLPSKGQRGTT